MSSSYAHTSLVARDWRRLAAFYEAVFGCVRLPGERDLSGQWLEHATGVAGARIRGIHLRLPGYGAAGPTLEIFQYDPVEPEGRRGLNVPGLSHIAFQADDVAALARRVREHGGSDVGRLSPVDLPGIGSLVFQYVADPEGNIIELQKWTEGGPAAASCRGTTNGNGDECNLAS